MSHILAECGALKLRGAGRDPTRTSRQWRFALRLGDCLGSSTLRAAVFTHPADATGTKGGFEGETASIVAAKITLRRC